uniref:DNA-binding response regulator n=1 Tax=uncultured prokaryote TaxID=198431 RepID=H5SEL7_9ZZZZ|nr:DNA-binding response regulator [uncultured prokaryote]
MDRITGEDFDLMIIDYTIPDIDGAELIHHVKSLKPSIPIIVLIGSWKDRKFLDAGADLFIAKPFDLKDIRKAIASLSGRADLNR